MTEESLTEEREFCPKCGAEDSLCSPYYRSMVIECNECKWQGCAGDEIVVPRQKIEKKSVTPQGRRSQKANLRLRN